MSAVSMFPNDISNVQIDEDKASRLQRDAQSLASQLIQERGGEEAPIDVAIRDKQERMTKDAEALAFELQSDNSSFFDQTTKNIIGGAIDGMLNSTFIGSVSAGIEARSNGVATLAPQMLTTGPMGAAQAVVSNIRTVRHNIGRLFSNGDNEDFATWQTTQERLGLTESQWDGMSVEDRQKAILESSAKDIQAYTEADPDSLSYQLASIAGSLVDPTTAIPIAGPTRLARAASGAAVGGADTAVYSYTHEGKVDPTMVGVGLVLGGTLGALTKAQAKNLQATDKVELFNKVYTATRAGADNHANAYNTALRETGFTADELATAAKDSHAKLTGRMDRKQASTALQNELGATQQRSATWVPKAIDNVLQPMSDAVRRISPAVHRKVQDTLRKSMETAHNTMNAVDPYLRSVERLKHKDREAFLALRKAMFTGSNDVIPLTEKYLGKAGLDNLALYRKAQDAIFDKMTVVRPGMPKVNNYFNRWVKDSKKLQEHLTEWQKSLGKDELAKYNVGGAIDQMLVDKSAALKRALTQDETAGVYNKYFSDMFLNKPTVMKPGAAKSRALPPLPDEILNKILDDAYASFPAAAHSAIRQVSEDIAVRNMFGKDIVSKSGDNITQSLGEFAAKEGIVGDDATELKTLLELLFAKSKDRPNSVIQGAKDIGYMAYLGQPTAAAVQLGDVFITATKVGALNAMHGLAQAVRGKGINPAEAGLLDNMLEEMVSSTWTKRGLDKVLSNFDVPGLKHVSFRNVDRIGKATLMNGTLNKIQKQAMSASGISKLRAKWGKGFGDEWAGVESAIRNSKGKSWAELDPNIKTMIFMDLADIQPITMFEQAKAYANNPNWRFLYMMRTFTMKYLNLLRRDVLDNLADGKFKPAAVAFTGLTSAYMAGGISIDYLKSQMLDRKFDADNVVADNLMKMVGLNRYAIGQASVSKKPITDTIASQMPPILGWMNPIARAGVQLATGNHEITRESEADMVKLVPGIGSLLYNYSYGGKEKANQNIR